MIASVKAGRSTMELGTVPIADDASNSPMYEKILEAEAQVEPRIKLLFREENGNISAASNSALAPSGDFLPPSCSTTTIF